MSQTIKWNHNQNLAKERNKEREREMLPIIFNDSNKSRINKYCNDSF